MIKGVLFDIGKVLLDWDTDIFLRGISKFTDKSVPEMRELIYFSSDLPERYETGLISSDDFFNEVSNLCNLKMQKSRFIKAFTSIFSPMERTQALVRRLKPNYKLAVVSNMSEWHFKHIIKEYDIFELFDALSFSFELKKMKPDKKIYADSLHKLGLKPTECAYIDDIKEYVISASKMGIHSIHYISYEELVNSLRKLDIKF